MLALGRGRVVEVWKDVMGRGEKQKAPYMSHTLKGEVSKVEFCPFEDCLGIGHSSGFTSIIVPGVCVMVWVCGGVGVKDREVCVCGCSFCICTSMTFDPCLQVPVRLITMPLK